MTKEPVDVRLARERRARTLLEAGTTERDRIKAGLPHLYGFKWYAWAKSFFDSRNQMNLLCAANQISKSSTQLRKMIHWATYRKMWPELWPGRTPRQFWLLYPSKEVATAEWHTKIEPEFMPRNEFKTHPVYGWTAVFDKKMIHSVHFNSGVTVYFKSYSQDVHTLQSGTCDAIFCDEELVEDLLPELQARLYASEGYFHMVFTATRNQLMWLRAIEGRGDEELFKDAFKLQVSMYDCQTYIDGTAGHFDKEKIAKIIGSCKNKTEVLRRVYGKFVRESGRVYSEFSALTHFIKEKAIGPDWHVYSAIDNGSGGGEGHPAAFVFIAVRPDKRLGYVYRGWRGDDMLTTAGDVLEKWDIEKRGDKPVQTVYDWAAKDMATIADRMGIPLTKAEKSHEIGEDIVNVLFKNNMLYLFDTPELRKAGTEFMSVMKETPKRRRKDDLSDAIRYACCAVPWDWSAIQGKPTEEEHAKRQKERPWTAADQEKADLDARRGIKEARRETEEGWEPLTTEFDFWNDAYGNG